MNYIFLALAFCLNAAANIMLKLGAERGLEYKGMGLMQIISHNYLVLIGLALFAGNLVFYLLALRSLPISLAYPIMVAMSFIIISTFSFLYLKEPIGIYHIMGYLLLIAGMVMVLKTAVK